MEGAGTNFALIGELVNVSENWGDAQSPTERHKNPMFH